MEKKECGQAFGLHFSESGPTRSHFDLNPGAGHVPRGNRRPDPHACHAELMYPTFGRAPFQCTFFVGPTRAALLPEVSDAEHVRMSGIGEDLDLLLHFEPSPYRGERMRLPNTGTPVFMCNKGNEVGSGLCFSPVVSPLYVL